jgi:L-aminopeptidase/D-esterase-like protein
VNSFGAVNDREGKIVRGHFDREKGKHVEFTSIIDEYAKLTPAKNQNTTLTLVYTNQKFQSDHAFNQAARQIHSSMSRSINPFNIIGDGDVLFLVSTEEIDDSSITPSAFGVLAGEVAWDAVLSCFE